MRKNKLVSVRVPEDVLEKLDELLKREGHYNRSAVICALLNVATCTFKPKQLGQLCCFDYYYGHRVSELHLVYQYYGSREEIHFVDEGQKGTDE